VSDAERWNLSPERLYIDTWTRWFLRENLPWSAITSACNVGIGHGEFDDWLAFALPEDVQLVSLDHDREITLAFEQRQRDEGHPRPSRIVHEDLFTTTAGPFDLVTATGTVLHESGDPAGALQALSRLVTPGGWLYAVHLHRLGGEDVLAGVAGVVHRRRFDAIPGAALTAVLANPR